MSLRTPVEGVYLCANHPPLLPNSPATELIGRLRLAHKERSRSGVTVVVTAFKRPKLLPALLEPDCSVAQ